MSEQIQKISFASDYMEGAHPAILRRLEETNLIKSPGYGTDLFSENAREKIRAACSCPDAEVFFLTGGTQTNATVIDALLASYQGVIAPETGHIGTHEAGAIECGGHKVLALTHEFGKIKSQDIEKAVKTFQEDLNHDHMVMPGMVYISQPTEYGTLYTLDELEAISGVCRRSGLYLYVDGARLADALASPSNDVTLPDLSRLCDAFYIGGTKCGALFGEALIFPKKNLIPHFFTIIKQHGALFAKGRLLGVQFETLFTDDLYYQNGKNAVEKAAAIQALLRKHGFRLLFESPTNQIFVIMVDELLKKLEEQVEVSFWEKFDETHTVVRFATSWTTDDEDVERLGEILANIKQI